MTRWIFSSCVHASCIYTFFLRRAVDGPIGIFTTRGIHDRNQSEKWTERDWLLSFLSRCSISPPPRADFFTFVETKAMESGRKGRREEGEIVRDERR